MTKDPHADRSARSRRHGARRSPSAARAGRISRGSAGAARFAHRRRRATDCASWQVALLDALGVARLRASIRALPSRAPATRRKRARGFWLHVQPMHFMAGLDRLTAVMLARGERASARAELAELEPIDRRASASRGDAAGHDVATATGWCAVERALDVQTATPEIAAASPLEQAMPQGRDAPALRRLMTELQMLLHEHPVNVARAPSRSAGDQCSLVSWSGRNPRRAALRSAAGFRRRPVPARDLSIERQRRDGRAARCAGIARAAAARARSSSSRRRCRRARGSMDRAAESRADGGRDRAARDRARSLGVTVARPRC